MEEVVSSNDLSVVKECLFREEARVDLLIIRKGDCQVSKAFLQEAKAVHMKVAVVEYLCLEVEVDFEQMMAVI